MTKESMKVWVITSVQLERTKWSSGRIDPPEDRYPQRLSSMLGVYSSLDKAEAIVRLHADRENFDAEFYVQECLDTKIFVEKEERVQYALHQCFVKADEDHMTERTVSVIYIIDLVCIDKPHGLLV